MIHALTGPKADCGTLGVDYVGSGGVGGHLAYSRYRAVSFTLGGATLRAPPAEVSNASAGTLASRSVAGNIGLRAAERKRTLTIHPRDLIPRKP